MWENHCTCPTCHTSTVGAVLSYKDNSLAGTGKLVRKKFTVKNRQIQYWQKKPKKKTSQSTKDLKLKQQTLKLKHDNKPLSQHSYIERLKNNSECPCVHLTQCPDLNPKTKQIVVCKKLKQTCQEEQVEITQQPASKD